MVYIYQITLLWCLLGIISWLVGRITQNFPGPKQETLDRLAHERIAFFAHPPQWAMFLCALPNAKKDLADPISLQFQLGGLILVVISVAAGFLNTPTLLALGIWISMSLYAVIPARFIKRWVF
jgi:hypothetical protein